jgi:diaminohydroxyphosphoribosylaminopyrimidine deaminase/5-amino-6-(5-phosphoribosylamino)uracil reductase
MKYKYGGGETVSLDEQYMGLALKLAESNSGQTSPNPLVGAVVVKDHQIVGMGAHLKAGEAHAEVHALNMAGEKAKGATLYVTLEPCSHYGRTPPCAERVIQSGIRRVIVAALDPNPLVAGRGVEKLKAAGINVNIGLLQEQSERMNEIYNFYIVHQRPFVTLKTATTLDGKIATITGESQWITGEEARADVHLLRHHHDAIVVGVNTVLADNPRLTTRLEGEKGNHPIRLIMDSKLRTPLDAQILDTTEAPTWIFTSKRASVEKIEQYEEKGVRIFQSKDEDRVSIDFMLQTLGQEQIASLLVEGGGELNASFLQGNYVNKVIAYLAPTLIGGNLAPSSFRGEGFTTLSNAVHLEDIQYVQVGQDLKVIGYPGKGA